MECLVGRKRRPDWERQLDEMPDEQRGCRDQRHWWPNEFQVEWVHLEEYPNGSIKLGERRLPCTRPCGAVKKIRIKFLRGGHREQVGSTIDYSGCKGTYLFKIAKGADKPTRADVRQAVLDRIPVPTGMKLP